jgi:hypothetical protein
LIGWKEKETIPNPDKDMFKRAQIKLEDMIGRK